MSVQISGTSGINTNTLTVTGSGNTPPQTLTDEATINWDWSAAQVAEVVLGGSRILANPTNAVSGQFASLRVARVGGYLLSFGPLFKGVNSISQSQLAGQVDHLVFRFNGTNFELVSFRADIGA